MKIVLNDILANRSTWSLSANGDIQEGVHLITGEVGCGKTTLALMLAGFFSPTSGTIVKDGISSQMISFQFPDYHITGRTLAAECRSWGLDPSRLLSMAHISRTPDSDPLTLSRGELKRLLLTCLLEKEYDLLILDEPFSSLDCCEKERYCRILSDKPPGITIILTHEQSFFPRVDYLWEIHEGHLFCIGKTPEAIQQWEHAPPLIKKLVESGRTPRNISPEDLLEAACRM
nr:ATP-binding cassette domain-containing protein [uncultured Methanoregula sp.]